MLRPSVVHLTAPAPFGGLESVVLTLAAGQARAGHEVTVIGTFTTPPDGQPFWDAAAALDGVRAVPLVFSPRRYLAEHRAIARTLEEVPSDVIHSHGYRADAMAASLGGRLGLKTVSTVHGFSGQGLKNSLYEWLQTRLLGRFDGVVAVSRAIEAELRENGVPPAVLTTLPNAWAPTGRPLSRSQARSELGLPDNQPIIGWVGRMSPEKAPDVALEAFAGVTVPESRLVFIGDGPERSALEAVSRRLGIANRVHWAGVVPGAGRLLPAFDVLCLSSWTEGTPIVLLEAMAAQVPIVTTAVGGIPDVVSGKEALLVDAGNRESLARAMSFAILDPEGAQARATAARARVECDYDPKPWVERYARVYGAAIRRSCR